MIIGLLEQFQGDLTFVSLVQDFNGIKSVYDGLSAKSDINETEIASLSMKVGEVRAKIISH